MGWRDLHCWQSLDFESSLSIDANLTPRVRRDRLNNAPFLTSSHPGATNFPQKEKGPRGSGCWHGAPPLWNLLVLIFQLNNQRGPFAMKSKQPSQLAVVFFSPTVDNKVPLARIKKKFRDDESDQRNATPHLELKFILRNHLAPPVW